MHANLPTLLGKLVDGTGVFLAPDDRRRSVYVVGKPGAGKSNLLLSMMIQDLQAGRSFTFLDPKGDTSKIVADHVPKDRIDGAIYWEPFDDFGAIGFNPLRDVAPAQRALVADNIVSTFADLWGLDPKVTPRAIYILQNDVALLLENPGCTLLDVSRVLTDDEFRAALLRRTKDPAVAGFWRDEFDRYEPRFRKEAIAPLQNKAGQFRLNPAIRRIFGQPKGKLDIKKLIDDPRGRCLIVNLSKGKLGNFTSSLVGSMLTTAFAQAANARADLEEEKRRDHCLYMDEFQNFKNPIVISILSEARAMRLSMVLAHQFLSQLEEELQDAVLGTASTTIAFRVGAKDAPLIAEELCIDNPRALVQIGNYKAWIKLLSGGAPADPRVLETFALPEAAGTFKSVQANTRARWMTPAKQADEIVAASFPKPKRRDPDRHKPRVFSVTETGLKEI